MKKIIEKIHLLITINHKAFKKKRYSQLIRHLVQHNSWPLEHIPLINKDQPTTHHIIYRHLGGSAGKRNEVKLSASLHQRLHQQFPSHLPHEQIRSLIDASPQKNRNPHLYKIIQLLNLPHDTIYKKSARENNTTHQDPLNNPLIQKALKKQLSSK